MEVWVFLCLSGLLKPKQTQARLLSQPLTDHPLHQLLSACLYGPRNWKQAAWWALFLFVPRLELKLIDSAWCSSESICEILRALATALSFELFDLERALCGNAALRNQARSSLVHQRIAAGTTAVSVFIFDILTGGRRQQVLHICATTLFYPPGKKRG